MEFLQFSSHLILIDMLIELFFGKMKRSNPKKQEEKDLILEMDSRLISTREKVQEQIRNKYSSGKRKINPHPKATTLAMFIVYKYSQEYGPFFLPLEECLGKGEQ